MKIILPVIDNGFKKGIAQSFHNAELACIYHCSSETYEWLATKKLNPGNGGLAEVLRQIGISAVISKQMPLMALGFFTESGLAVYRAGSESIEENISLFKANQLELLTSASAQNAGSCSGSCTACNTSCNS
jgi:predicted Fe-Mo cluster-binding NifX family protein